MRRRQQKRGRRRLRALSSARPSLRGTLVPPPAAGMGPGLERDRGPCLIAGPQLVAKRLDDVVGRHCEVGGALGEERSHRRDHSAGGRHLHAVGGRAGRAAEIGGKARKCRRSDRPARCQPASSEIPASSLAPTCTRRGAATAEQGELARIPARVCDPRQSGSERVRRPGVPQAQEEEET